MDALTTVLVTTQPRGDALVAFYAEHLRGPIFGALLAAALAWVAVLPVLQEIVRKLTNSPLYIRRHELMRELDPELERLGPERWLMNFVFGTLVLIVVAAVAQVTIGMLSSRWAALTCIFLGGIPVGCALFVCWTYLRWSHATSRLQERHGPNLDQNLPDPPPASLPPDDIWKPHDSLAAS